MRECAFFFSVAATEQASCHGGVEWRGRESSAYRKQADGVDGRLVNFAVRHDGGVILHGLGIIGEEGGKGSESKVRK